MIIKKKYIFLAVLLSVFSYYIIEIIYARSHTIETANKYLSNIKIEKQELTKKQLEILIKVQDPNFFNHKGVEFHTPGSGWTTITQSLAKIFYFKNFREGLPKIKQTLCARFALHPLISKDLQITLFINLMYFGDNQYGIVDAAKHYYSKEVNKLNEEEYISLIASLIAPAILNKKNNPEGNHERVERIKKMLTGEYIPRSLLDIRYDKNQEK
jgi:membrane carboxypeptidase/penicillin-binding protein